MLRYSENNLMLSVAEPHVSKTSFYLVLLFWLSTYITGLRDLIYGYKGWVILLSVWAITFMMTKTTLKRFSVDIIAKRSSEIAMLFLWTMVIVFNMILDRGELTAAYQHFAQTMVIWVIYLTAVIYLYKSPLRFDKNLLVIIIALSSTCVIILPVLYNNPQIVRQIKYEVDIVSRINYFFVAGTTNFFSSYSIALPCLYVYSLQQKGMVRIISIMLCLLLIITVWLSTMVSAIILVFIGLLGVALFSRNSLKIIGLTLFITISIAVALYIYSSELEQLDFALRKISFIMSSVQDEGIYHVERGNDAALSLATINENPFFGVGPVAVGTFELIGEHSSWLDNIAQYGAIGFAPFLCFLFLGLRRLWRSHSLDKKNMMLHARIVCFLLYLIHGLVNPWAFDSTAVALFITIAMAPE